MEESLFIHQILFELSVEGAGVAVIAGRGGEDLGVPGPAQALAALGAVGGHVDKVGFQAPEGIFIQAVELGVSGLDKADPLQVGREYAAPKALFFQLSHPAADAHIAEAEEGKVGVNGLPLTAGDVLETGARVPIVFVVKVSLLQDFPEVQGDGRARGKVRVEFRKTCKVLAEVQHRLPGGGVQDFPHRQRFRHRDGQAQAVCQM